MREHVKVYAFILRLSLHMQFARDKYISTDSMAELHFLILVVGPYKLSKHL